MYKYNIYIGMFDKDTKTQVLSNTEFLNTVRKIMRLYNIDCYTIYKCKGHYKHIDNTVICEPSINIEYISKYDLYNNYFVGLINNIKTLLNQESVLITKQDIQVL
jgi:hypothetical protein